MKQSELCGITKIPKSAISQYISGAFEPKQDRVYLIAQALNVSEAWLMGFDVPMERERNSPEEPQLSEGEMMLLELFRRVPEEQQQLVLQMIRAALGTKE
jgi:transcriptional regulator with XRE-family HTH domain